MKIKKIKIKNKKDKAEITFSFEASELLAIKSVLKHNSGANFDFENVKVKYENADEEFETRALILEAPQYCTETDKRLDQFINYLYILEDIGFPIGEDGTGVF